MALKIPIRNYNLPKSPRVCDVTVDESGEILEYEMQNIKGCVYIEAAEMNRQIQEALTKKAG